MASPIRSGYVAPPSVERETRAEMTWLPWPPQRMSLVAPASMVSPPLGWDTWTAGATEALLPPLLAWNMTGAGVKLSVYADPSPSWPALLAPQAQRDPSDLSAYADLEPAAMAVTPEPEPKPVTWTGVDCWSVV